VLLWQQHAREVDARRGDVRVDVDATGHHHHPSCVDLWRIRRHIRHDLSVAHADIAHVAVDAIRGVVDGAAGDS
jgi:hypothetical protein